MLCNKRGHMKVEDVVQKYACMLSSLAFVDKDNFLCRHFACVQADMVAGVTLSLQLC